MALPKACSLPVLLFLLTCQFSSYVSAQQDPYKQYLDLPWVDSVLSTLSREAQVAQSIWVQVGPEDGLRELIETGRLVRDLGLGGLIFTEGPTEQMQQLADYCLSSGSIVPVLALEGRWNATYPDMMSLAALSSDSLAYLAGANLAVQLRKAGVSLVLEKGMEKNVAAGLRDGKIQVLDPSRVPGWTERINRVKASRLSEIDTLMEALTHDDHINFSARQVLALKYGINQLQAEKGTGVKEGKLPGETDQPAFIRDLYSRSLTVLNNRDQLIPLKELEHSRIACLAVNEQQLTEFQQLVGLYTKTDQYFWMPGNNHTELIKKLESYDVVIAGVYPGPPSEAMEDFLSALKTHTRLILVWFGDPASLDEYKSIASDGSVPDPAGLILSYEQNPLTERLSAQLIFGGIGGRGRLPVAIGDRYSAGHGLDTSGKLRLQYGYPENAGLCSTRLNQGIDSIVNRGLKAGAYPGCQVIIARKGIVVFHKAFGYHTYDKRIEVRKNDLYDLASVTKVAGPLSGLMLLEGQGKFSHQKQLGDYCKALKRSDKASLDLKDVLAHRAGLYPWIPYHEHAIKKNGHYKKRFIRPDSAGKFSVHVADRLYLKNTYKAKIFKEIRKSELGEKKYLYSGLSFFLFPTIIEELSGMPYEAFLGERIYHRLGAWELLFHPRSTFPGSRIVPTEYDSLFRKQLVHGYVHDEGAALMGAYAGNAGLFASSNDLLKLIEMYRRMGSYGGEQIIPSEVLREYTAYQFPELNIRRGLGFDKPLLGEKDGSPDDYPCPGASRSSFGHSGFTGTFVWADPECEISYVFLSNRVYPTRRNSLLYELDIRTSILQSVYDSMIEP